MIVREVALCSRRLKPMEWHVRSAISPFATAWGWKWWSILVCEEGLAAFQFAQRRFWAYQLRAGLVAGVSHVTPVVHGDEWPLGGKETIVAPRAMLFPRDSIKCIEVQRARVFWSHVRIFPSDGGRSSFDLVDPRQVTLCAERIEV